MKYIEIVTDKASSETVAAAAVKAKARDFRLGPVSTDGLQAMRMLVDDGQLQSALDALQAVMGAHAAAHVVVLPVEVFLPMPPDCEDTRDSATAAREALYESVSKGAHLNSNFVLLLVLSTVVAAIGLIENNPAVVIGAMVIAPLLGPNLALSLATALGDNALLRKSATTLVVGIALAVSLSALYATLTGQVPDSQELMARTHATFSSAILALASGAAAALSLTTGLSGVLVGVMVAVALLPPAVTLGILIGSGQSHPALGAALLLAVNVVCVNLAAKVVFLLKDIRPRTWIAGEHARRATLAYILGWVVMLLALLGLIYLRNSHLILS